MKKHKHKQIVHFKSQIKTSKMLFNFMRNPFISFHHLPIDRQAATLFGQSASFPDNKAAITPPAI